jgi:3-methyladenine DNA glycosylase AlkD
MVSTMAFIRNDDFEDTLKLAEIFMSHTHDLMHKACGWMLREVGKRNEKLLWIFWTRIIKTCLEQC